MMIAPNHTILRYYKTPKKCFSCARGYYYSLFLSVYMALLLILYSVVLLYIVVILY